MSARHVTLYLLASVALVLHFGLAVERSVLLVWLFGLLAIAVAAEAPERLRGLVRDWGAFAALLLVYRYSAGLADSVGRPVVMTPLADIDRALGFGEVPTVRLQGAFDQTGEGSWWQTPLSFVYVSHFGAVLVAGALLWLRDRSAWVGYTKRLLTLSAAAVATYILFPAAPPWMAAEAGVIPEVERSPFLGWGRIGLDIMTPVIEQGRAFANPVAALPSMHAGFAMFLACFFWPRVSGRGKVALAVYASAMAFTLVLTGEHWVVDVLLGWLYVALVMTAWARWEARGESGPAEVAVDGQHGAGRTGWRHQVLRQQ